MTSNPNEQDDAVELLQNIATGDENAMRSFYQLFQSAVYAFAMKRLNNQTDAVEVLNEVMFDVWRSADRFQGRSKVKTWLLGIANFKVIDVLRKRGRTDHEDLDDDVPDENEATAFSEIAGQHDAGLIRQCLEKLKDVHRQVVHLVFFEELSYPEIAEILECPSGTVKTRMMHAKSKLKRCLQGLGFV
ncbi:MAG: sigma-70 family RNA polymerase sigma factor [Gammaproteobacteria bacterium]|nr:sigma-70 family RNA polymerase sigma factor [Gammaproteobacteria bacterium]MDH5593793.1 sigma-70 family RNA polymerase sigma factor [Gammaproteobacteria bacterium]MDH5613519.1 sigma-70 family RNA polymerase sigma factor [Gammaproteobacteria bacterium]